VLEQDDDGAGHPLARRATLDERGNAPADLFGHIPPFR